MDRSAQAEAVLERIANFAIELTQGTPVPGGSVRVVDRNGLVGEFAFGYADVIAQTPARLDHRYEIGSISKTFTSLLIYALVDDKLIDLDEPVTTYLPWFVGGEPDAPMTARHLLSHTAGLILGSDHIPDELAQVWGMRNLARSGALGERFHYSNLGFMTLGAIVEAVTGDTVASQLRRRVFEPMGISDARVGVTHVDHATMATGHWPLHDDRPWTENDPLAHATWFEVACADGNVAANIHELSELARLMLGDGTLDSRRIVTQSAMNEIVAPNAPTGEGTVEWGNSPKVDSSRYGLGVNVEFIDGNHCVTHGGGMVGYATFMLADRTSGIGVAVLTNGNGDYPAAQLVARVTHQQFVAELSGRSVPALPPTSARLLVSEISEQHLGDFHGVAHDGSRLSLTISSLDGIVHVECKGQRAPVYRTWTARFATSHPDLRRFHLQIVDDYWTFGPYALRRSERPVVELTSVQQALVGHYRCYSPWYTNFRIIAREGQLYLVAPGGVESQTEDCLLIELNDGEFRIGQDPWMPERLLVGPIVGGRAISVIRDGCLYSRSFTQ